MRRRLFILVAVIGSFAFHAAAAAAKIGEVVTLHGEAALFRDEQQFALKNLTAIQTNDTIETAKESQVVIVFKDGSKLTAGSHSSITIDRFVFDPQTVDGTSTINVGKGVFRFISGQLKRNKATIQTPVSTIGIRGTEIFGEVEPTGATSVALVECCVDISNDAGSVGLETAGTFSFIASRDTIPSKPIICDIGWVEKTAAALGLSKEELNY